MSDLGAKFGARLRTLRKESGMTQEELAGAAGLSVDFLSLIERGINSPSFKTLEKLADALDVSEQEMFEFEK